MRSEEEYDAMVSRFIEIRTALVLWSIMLGFMLGFGFGIFMGWVL